MEILPLIRQKKNNLREESKKKKKKKTLIIICDFRKDDKVSEYLILLATL